MQHRLIGKLINYVKNLHIIHSQKNFTAFLFHSSEYTVHDTTIASIALYDYFPTGELDTMNNLFNNRANHASYLQSYYQFLLPLSKVQKIEMNSFLLQTIQETIDYGKKRNPNPSKPDDWGIYDLENKNRMITYLEHTCDNSLATPYNLYVYIYYAVNKKFPPFLAYGQQYLSDLEEFNEAVLCKYGVVSEPGKRAIIELALRRKNPDTPGNLFALCEYADMLYYGDNILGKPNYPEAIKIYRTAAGLNNVQGMETVCHPLALFSLSYIFYNYHRRGKLKNIPDIEYLEKYTDLERIEIAILYSKQSLSIMKTGAAYNNLGVISENLSADLVEKYSLLPAQNYYQKATEYNYVYAYNNLATQEIKALNSDPDHEMLHLNNCIQYLSKAAESLEPWASNWLGNFYLSGKVRYSNKIYKNVINRDLAKKYFFKALDYHIDRNSAWAAANLIVYFPDIYIQNKYLLFTHIDICLTKGNDEVLEFLAKSYNIDCTNFIHQQTVKWETFCYNFRNSIINKLL